MTKREKFERVMNFVTGTEVSFSDEERAEMLEWCDKEIAALNAKNEKAKQRAAEKRAAGDELRERVYAAIGDAAEPITVNGILEAMCDSSLTPAKITARTRQLVAAGMVEKQMVKMDGRKLTAYTLA